ncbi:tyrosine-type recombinase/integrase [Neptunomonas qingdaonensis]|uniref:Site-specific recombinase XerD n=1 Tax=Neptunomonas qingdaonensis TaxID=1045558 RepID=A0A1I2N232_9GAMM|nr:site-specific integrase [Neptunomonas qingdaonensis]SFF95797.1 Site-specific recombinase XerD [Neptunomonas qingdaonensis]
MSSSCRFKFSKKLIDELPPTPSDSASRETEYSDEACTGLRLIVNRAGRKRYLLRYSIFGKKKAIQIGEHGPFDVKDARLKANELKKMVSNDIDPQEERSTRRAVLTLEQFAEEHYLPYAHANKRTVQSDIGIFNNHLYPVWKDRRLTDISKQDVQKVLDSKKGQLKPATINRVLSLIHRMFRLACEWGYLEINPASLIKKLKENNQRNVFLSKEQVARFLKACDEEPNATAKNALKLALLSGMRIGEILSAKWKELEYTDQGACLFLPHTKAGQSRTVLLNDGAVAILEDQKQNKRAGNPHIFPGRAGSKPMSHPKKAFARIKEKAGGMDQLRVHDLRHSFASILINSGSATLYDVQHLLGHHNSQTTERYAHLASDRLRNVSSHVNDFVQEAKAG